MAAGGTRTFFPGSCAISVGYAECGIIAVPSGRGVAQPGSAPALGAGGRWFESSRPDHSLTFVRSVGATSSGVGRLAPPLARIQSPRPLFEFRGDTGVTRGSRIEGNRPASTVPGASSPVESIARLSSVVARTPTLFCTGEPVVPLAPHSGVNHAPEPGFGSQTPT